MKTIHNFLGLSLYYFFKPFLVLIGHYKNARYHPGYNSSSVVSVPELKKRQDDIWTEKNVNDIQGIDFNHSRQLGLAKQFAEHYKEMPYPEKALSDFRYHLNNLWYPYTDGIVLYAMIRQSRPKRIIEVGSGYSSAVMLDTNEYFMDHKMQLMFIEPNPRRLFSIYKKEDYGQCEILESTIQQVPLETFKKLKKGDVFFVDSSHVGKTGSDVLHILFEILPVLKSGVIIHFHDVFYPFEYPKQWVFAGRNWNEDYFLRSFLIHNQHYEILFFSHYLHTVSPEAFEEMPLAYKQLGSNLWIEKK